MYFLGFVILCVSMRVYFDKWKRVQWFVLNKIKRELNAPHSLIFFVV
ncbi:hypothetical protein VT99_10273 [Candidatus Electrothrix marina]|uniref:Uncharacterized protein n=1 Tax=Candidatus Electrothrix marina TaxID=1859130 RepID=A0A3S4TF09_9BACT|nr:hypothetical protein VT99_10273 [Candidatus Electrothrix marina]